MLLSFFTDTLGIEIYISNMGLLFPIYCHNNYYFVPLQASYAQQQQTSVYHPPAAMVQRVSTTMMTMCACAPQYPYHTQANTVMSFLMPV